MLRQTENNEKISMNCMLFVFYEGRKNKQPNILSCAY